MRNRKLFKLLFEACVETLLEVAVTPGHLGAEIGFLGGVAARRCGGCARCRGFESAAPPPRSVSPPRGYTPSAHTGQYLLSAYSTVAGRRLRSTMRVGTIPP